MIPWFLREPERFKLERIGIEALSQSADWLIGTEWRPDKDGLGLDAVIRVGGHDYELRVSFPTLYPDTPLIVRPKNMESRVSSHQYGGADGPLCLEWGPDNWHRDVTSVQMLESAHRLLDIENPLGDGRPVTPVVAPSRHELTMGQELRGKWMRWYAGDAIIDYIMGQSGQAVGTFKFLLLKQGESWVSLVNEALSLEGGTCTDHQIPTMQLGSVHIRPGIWFKTDLDKRTIGQPKKLAELKELLAGVKEAEYLITDGSSPVEDFGKYISGVLIVDKTGELHLFIVFSDEDVLMSSRVKTEEEPVQTRSPNWAALNSKTIGIVGLGSVGSKIAMSLTRMGCRKFYLVDYDVLLPENLRRHALDWQGVAQHKVDAMKIGIGLLAPDAQIEVSRLHITGQESNAAISGVLDRLASCDILIDATANAKVFNLLAAVARAASLPMVWMEVFGGGLGGLVARCRPRTDPTPQDMRGAYLQFCADNPAPDFGPVHGNYAIENSEGEVLVASDADVAIIAHHAARFVSDCFVPPEHSIFPYSMYLIGLTEGWIFLAPFDTRPISMELYSVTGWEISKSQNFDAENVKFLCDLFKKADNATANTP